jgi:hypothetical protein
VRNGFVARKTDTPTYVVRGTHDYAGFSFPLKSI